MIVIEDPRRVVVLRDAQTRWDDADQQLQYVPQSGGQPNGAAQSEVIRPMKDEMEYAISSREAFWKRNGKITPAAPNGVLRAVLDGENVFTELVEACKVYTQDQLAHSLYEVGGQFRRGR